MEFLRLFFRRHSIFFLLVFVAASTWAAPSVASSTASVAASVAAFADGRDATRRLCSSPSCQCSLNKDFYVIICDQYSPSSSSSSSPSISIDGIQDGGHSQNEANESDFLSHPPIDRLSLTTTPSIGHDVVPVSISWLNAPLDARLATALAELGAAVRVLRLENCSLETSPDFLASTPSLRRLSLAGNSIESVDEALGWLETLEDLDLSDNKLRHFRLRLRNLRTLDLSGNELSRFNVEAPIAHPSTNRSPTAFHLESLDLSSNRLTSLSFLSRLQRLRDLDASFNAFRRLRLPTSPSLVRLRLTGNERLRYLPAAAFAAAPLLASLRLDRLTSLRHVSRQALEPLAWSLKELRLGEAAELRRLHPSTLEPLDNLMLVDLSGNSMTCRRCAVPRLYHGAARNGAAYILDGAEIRCSCENSWIFDAARNHAAIDGVFVKVDGAVCVDDAGERHLVEEFDAASLLRCDEAAPAPRAASNSPSSFRHELARLGSVARLTCALRNGIEFDGRRVTWTTPTGRRLTFDDVVHDLASLKEEKGEEAVRNEGIRWRAENLYVNSDYPSRVIVDEDDAVVVSYVLGRDAGAWSCSLSDADERAASEPALTLLEIDFRFFNEGLYSVKVMSIVVGVATALSFLCVAVPISVVRWSVVRCFKTQEQNKYMRQFLENVEWYKAQQLERYHGHLERLRLAYSSECERLRGGCADTVERLRENCVWVREGCSNGMGKFKHKTSWKMERFREGASIRACRIRDYSASSVGRIRRVSTAQTEFLREAYEAQLARLKGLGDAPMGKLRDAYRQQQMLVQKIIDNLTYLGIVLPTLDLGRSYHVPSHHRDGSTYDDADERDDVRRQFSVDASDEITTLGFQALGLPVPAFEPGEDEDVEGEEGDEEKEEEDENEIEKEKDEKEGGAKSLNSAPVDVESGFDHSKHAFVEKKRRRLRWNGSTFRNGVDERAPSRRKPRQRRISAEVNRDAEIPAPFSSEFLEGLRSRYDDDNDDNNDVEVDALINDPYDVANDGDDEATTPSDAGSLRDAGESRGDAGTNELGAEAPLWSLSIEGEKTTGFTMAFEDEDGKGKEKTVADDFDAPRETDARSRNPGRSTRRHSRPRGDSIRSKRDVQRVVKALVTTTTTKCGHRRVIEFRKKNHVFRFCKDCDKALRRVRKRKRKEEAEEEETRMNRCLATETREESKKKQEMREKREESSIEPEIGTGNETRMKSDFKIEMEEVDVSTVSSDEEEETMTEGAAVVDERASTRQETKTFDSNCRSKGGEAIVSATSLSCPDLTRNRNVIHGKKRNVEHYRSGSN